MSGVTSVLELERFFARILRPHPRCRASASASHPRRSLSGGTFDR